MAEFCTETPICEITQPQYFQRMGANLPQGRLWDITDPDRVFSQVIKALSFVFSDYQNERCALYNELDPCLAVTNLYRWAFILGFPFQCLPDTIPFGEGAAANEAYVITPNNPDNPNDPYPFDPDPHDPEPEPPAVLPPPPPPPPGEPPAAPPSVPENVTEATINLLCQYIELVMGQCAGPTAKFYQDLLTLLGVVNPVITERATEVGRMGCSKAGCVVAGSLKDCPDVIEIAADAGSFVTIDGFRHIPQVECIKRCFFPAHMGIEYL